MDGLTEGRIVHYVLTEEDTKDIDRRRVKNVGHGEDWPAGAQAHVGNPAAAGDHVPMIVVVVWSAGPHGGTVNGQAFLDGNDSLWVTSATHDPDGAQGTWHWIEKA